MMSGGNTRASSNSKGGTKYDQGKPDLTLLPYSALVELSHVMGYGAAKYGRNNWKLGFSPERLLAAALRHIYAYADGEKLDPETGRTHLAHAMANCAMLITLEKETNELS